MSKTKIEIKSLVTNSKTQEYVDSLVDFFDSDEFEITTDVRQVYQKSLDPVQMDFIIGAGGFLGGYALSKYGLDPLVQSGEDKLRNLWKEINHKKSPTIPVKIIIKFEERDLNIETIPYLFDEEWLEQFFVRLDSIMTILDDNELLSSCKRIRLISQSIDNISIIVSASDNAKPTHIVNLEDKSVTILTESQIELFSEPKTDAQRWMQYELLRAKLYQQLVERQKK
jgi:hypothetical protein